MYSFLLPFRYFGPNRKSHDVGCPHAVFARELLDTSPSADIDAEVKGSVEPVFCAFHCITLSYIVMQCQLDSYFELIC